MKKSIFYLIVFLCFFALTAPAQTYQLTVSNGYGSGTYGVGDTVHVFAKELGQNQYFDVWAGDSAFLDQPENWHTTLVMPAQNVNLIAQTPTSALTMSFDSIRGQDRMKPVFYAFPNGYTGVIYFLHGSGGSANIVTSTGEVQNFLLKALSEGFAVIVSEAEEATTGIDANLDGALRWKTFPYNTNGNIDLANLSIIADSLEQRGLLSPNLPRYAVGISNGGWFAQSLAYAFSFAAAVSFIGQGEPALFDDTGIIETDRNTMWVMSENDGNALVGQQGLNDAFGYHQELLNEGVCSDFIVHRRYPLHPERFARMGLTISQSQNIYAELDANGKLDQESRPVQSVDVLSNDILANPANYPNIAALSGGQLVALSRQWEICYADHIFCDDYNGQVLDFLSDPCQPTALSEPNSVGGPTVFPNPTDGHLVLYLGENLLSNQAVRCALSTLDGQLLRNFEVCGSQVDMNVSDLPNGVYCLQVHTPQRLSTVKVVVCR